MGKNVIGSNIGVIDEHTKIPLFVVLGSIPLIVGGILWLTAIESKAALALEHTSEIKKYQTGTREMLIDVRERLIRIEERVNKR